MDGLKFLLPLLLLAISMPARTEEIQIDVVGLFTRAALLEVNGKQELLREGDRSKEGILLVSANSREAVIDLNGRRMTLNLSSRIGTRFKPAEMATVSIPLNDYGQYESSGMIDGQSVTFLIDTGASIVAMNATDAKRLGIDYTAGGPPHEATTAGGVVKSWTVQIDSIQLGGIRVRNVPAAVLEGGYPKQILLGMTFLRNVDIRQSANLMVLKSKF
ncbi:MAG TPA: TIGR02281 family clan AA aspartic protease [Pseudomonadales bacterium]|nr:TIGR02281 family clan AA aspartic protease [Pseudomonadales bacterium]